MTKWKFNYDFEKVERGVITVEEAKGTDTYVDVLRECSLTEDTFLHILSLIRKNGSRLETPYILS